MFIATEAARRELRQEFHVPVRTSLHFTPDGVSRPRAVITINIALLTEGQTTDHRLQSSDPFTIGPTSNHTPYQLFLDDGRHPACLRGGDACHPARRLNLCSKIAVR